MYIDLNCDMGESFGAWRMGDDERMMAHITSANIACGFHAGDPMVMQKTVRLAVANGVGVGAHPGFPDLVGFGRRNLQTSPGEIKAMMIYQIGALAAFAQAEGARIQHVKPHGALYNMAADNEAVADEVVQAVYSVNPEWILVTQPGCVLAELAERKGLRVAREVFPDRAYLENGRLAPRSMPGSVIHDLDTVKSRIVRLVQEGVMEAITGKSISLQADTLCIHGDTPGAVDLAALIRRELMQNGIVVMPMEGILKGKTPS